MPLILIFIFSIFGFKSGELQTQNGFTPLNLTMNECKKGWPEKLIPADSECITVCFPNIVKKLENFICTHPCSEEAFLEIQFTKDKTSRGARLCCASKIPFIFNLAPGVEALIHLKRSKNDQQFQLTYEADDKEEDAPIGDFSLLCGCTKVYNPWREHTTEEESYQTLPYGHYAIEIRSTSNLIINGKYRFYTQNGTVPFNRVCAVKLIGDTLTGTTFGIWYRDPEKSKLPVRINNIVAESCATDYKNSDCKQLSDQWKAFVDCVNKVDKEKRNAQCGNSGQFRLTLCPEISGEGLESEIDGELPI